MFDREPAERLSLDSLPQRQRDVLELIANLTNKNGYPPTLAELARAMGLRNRMTVHQHVAALKKKGFVHWAPGLNRSLQVVEPIRKQILGRKTKSASLEYARHKAPGIPLAGTIAAGVPIDALETCDCLELDSKYAGTGCFALKVKGNSMIEDGILDGDYVIIKPNPAPKNGEVVVVLLPDGSATLKRFFKEKTGFRLQPANRDLEPIFVSSAKELMIQGVVVGLFRNF